MGQPYVGEIRMTGFNFAPVGWMFCNGATLAISESETLFNLIGTTYGGDGQTTFNVPNLQGRMPIHQGPGFTMGQLGGAESVTLIVSQIPSHRHAAVGTSDGGSVTSPSNAVWAQSAQLAYHEPVAPQDVVTMAADDVQLVGGGQPHDNLMPYLTVNFIISLFGIYPSQ